MVGTLYLVSTPIGNLEDITLRAVRVLQEVAVIACEDARVSRKLCAAHDIRTPLVSHHAHSSTREHERLVERLQAGDDVALISDAGTPLLSDPGSELVQDMLRLGVPVVPIPGASAVLSALVASGLCPQPFTFLGFLSRTAGERTQQLAPFAATPATLVIYEAPGRVAKLLAHLQTVLSDRPAVVARELTKKFEEFARGALSQLAVRFSDDPPRGEVVIIVGPAPADAPVKADEVDEHIRRLRAAGERTADIAKVVAGAHGLPKKEVYQRVLALAEQADSSD